MCVLCDTTMTASKDIQVKWVISSVAVKLSALFPKQEVLTAVQVFDPISMQSWT